MADEETVVVLHPFDHWQDFPVSLLDVPVGHEVLDHASAEAGPITAVLVRKRPHHRILEPPFRIWWVHGQAYRGGTGELLVGNHVVEDQEHFLADGQATNSFVENTAVSCRLDIPIKGLDV